MFIDVDHGIWLLKQQHQAESYIVMSAHTNRLHQCCINILWNAANGNEQSRHSESDSYQQKHPNWKTNIPAISSLPTCFMTLLQIVRNQYLCFNENQ